MRIKICGITRPEDAQYAEKAGADAIGVVVFSGGVSRRHVPPKRAREIFGAVGPFTTTVAVSHTTSEEELRRMIALRPHAIQISHPFGFDEKPDVKIIRVIGRGDPLPEDCDAIIVDDSHGQGRDFDPLYAADAVKRSKIPVILAGGLTQENVGEAIRRVRPYAVDVASGVEISPGIKDHEKIRAFVEAVRSV
ncbi:MULTISPECIES: phosphoribosylanthranilate isomerase [unclassified Methanoregula]|uniref:phosphoribosylanthranilate isomerase n=1 Tax=unclassified Methanoregula TaxID=2649730 RepID=UPI0009C5B8C3|nr:MULTISPECIES: phosphoribosylanthranilate isomerase [unclassified Methanoregula]OPX61734.1 MAG: N-(5'-phosphoribosyl)anthranilate isomerase [Methanoregula sp. PtaB.Bin085]OPY33957.1 MAG: N-(5'-phosphoribosyl)anthranilate isomerase [Methanoregula sp. PtaU1.Bin006]